MALHGSPRERCLIWVASGERCLIWVTSVVPKPVEALGNRAAAAERAAAAQLAAAALVARAAAAQRSPGRRQSQQLEAIGRRHAGLPVRVPVQATLFAAAPLRGVERRLTPARLSCHRRPIQTRLSASWTASWDAPSRARQLAEPWTFSLRRDQSHFHFSERSTTPPHAPPPSRPQRTGGSTTHTGLIMSLVRNPDLQQAQVHNPDLAVGA